MKKLANPQAFFDHMRKTQFMGPTIDTKELAGCDADLKACGERNWPISWVAYAMATDYHETAGTMTPIKEYGSYSYYEMMYGPNGKNPARAKKMGNKKVGDGAKYCGRGRVQLTWYVNYAKASAKLGVDLINNPDKAMDSEVAADVMVLGMEEGWFTTLSCKNFLPLNGPASVEQFVKARAIINGKDKANKIAGYAMEFQKALILGGYA